jgi:hypothetical protein
VQRSQCHVDDVVGFVCICFLMSSVAEKAEEDSTPKNAQNNAKLFVNIWFVYLLLVICFG